MNSHYRTLFSPPTTSMNSPYRVLFSLPMDVLTTTSMNSHYHTNEFSLPGAVLTADRCRAEGALTFECHRRTRSTLIFVCSRVTLFFDDFRIFQNHVDGGWWKRGAYTPPQTPPFAPEWHQACLRRIWQELFVCSKFSSTEIEVSQRDMIWICGFGVFW